MIQLQSYLDVAANSGAKEVTVSYTHLDVYKRQEPGWALR